MAKVAIMSMSLDGYVAAAATASRKSSTRTRRVY
jgi:hypothetical protein